jgi:hypothetical protein
MKSREVSTLRRASISATWIAASLAVSLSTLGSFALVGCGSNLPGFAHPTGNSMDPKEMEGKDRIPYRTLTADDFLASGPPPDMKAYAERMGAVTCAHVFTYPDPQYFIEETSEGFHGAYVNLDFVAMMDRECSWWNPKDGSVPKEYILQHEQIHFALAEVAARKLDVKAEKVVAELRPKGKTQAEVEKVLVGTVEEMMKEGIEDLLERNRRFDQDTSNTYAPEQQQRWYDEVMAELK